MIDTSKISKWEENKLKVPFVIGLITWFILFLSLALYTLLGGESSFTEVFMYILIYSLLIVGVPTVIIGIVFVYIVKVVKMRPESSYEIRNINDYIKLQELYRSGDYEYETIRSKEDLFVAYKMGKKIVFTRPNSKALIWVGLVLIFIGLIIGIILELIIDVNLEIIRLIAFIIPFAIFGGIGALFFIPGILYYIRSPRTFFILAPEGIVYRKNWGDVRSYSWKELELHVYTRTITMRSMYSKNKYELPPTLEVHIFLPNGSRLKFCPGEYNLSEFLNNGNIALVAMAFKLYFDAAKAHFETQSTQEAGWKTNLIKTQEKANIYLQIYNYLKINPRKAFTVQSLFNRINEIGLSEKVKTSINVNSIEKILDDLFVDGKIIRQEKEGKAFYFY